MWLGVDIEHRGFVLIENRILNEIILFLDLRIYIDDIFKIIIINTKIILLIIFLFIFNEREMKMRNNIK